MQTDANASPLTDTLPELQYQIGCVETIHRAMTCLSLTGEFLKGKTQLEY